MSRPNKSKIPTDGSASQTGPGLFQAFAGLDLGSLPEAPPVEEAAVDSNRAPERPKRLGRVVLRRETAHRGGKCVVVVDDFDPSLEDAFIEALAKRLRASCGCGGAVKGRAIEVQGDQPARIRELLVAEGFRVAGVS